MVKIGPLTKLETYHYLEKYQIPYEVVTHPAVFNMTDAQRLALPHPEAEAKNLLIRDTTKTHYYLLVIHGDKRVDLKQFRQAQHTRRLTFASPEELMTYLGVLPGAVTPLGVLNDTVHRVVVYLDQEFGPTDLIGVHPNENTATIWLQTQDLIALLRHHGNEVQVTTF